MYHKILSLLICFVLCFSSSCTNPTSSRLSTLSFDSISTPPTYPCDGLPPPPVGNPSEDYAGIFFINCSYTNEQILIGYNKPTINLELSKSNIDNSVTTDFIDITASKELELGSSFDFSIDGGAFLPLPPPPPGSSYPYTPPPANPIVGKLFIEIDGVISQSFDIPNLNNFTKVFRWNGKYDNGQAVENGTYSLKAYIKSNSYNSRIYSFSKIIVVNGNYQPLPEGTEFFEVADFQKIVDLTSQLNVQTNSINNLYAKYKQLETYKEKKVSLQARPQTTETANKISQINTDITNLETDISSLASNVMIELSTLNNRKETLANHINTITKKQYITLTDKPDSVGSYSDSTYFSDLDLSNLLSDGITLYAPDKDDIDQDNLKETWEVDQERVEVLDPTNIFDATKALSDEIQTAKYLISDFITPNTIPNEDKLDAIQTLNTLLNNIKDHTTLFTTRTKKFSQDYDFNSQKIDYLSQALKAYFLLQLAEVNNKLDSGDAFLLQSLKQEVENDTFSIKKEGSSDFFSRHPEIKIDELNKITAKYGSLAVTYFNTPLFDNEEATRLFYGYSKEQWKALKDIDNGFTTTELTKATMDMARATLIPTTYGDLLLSAGTLFRGAKSLSKVNFKNTGEFLAQSKTLKNQATNVTAHAEKITAKNISKDCLNSFISIQSFNTQGFNTKALIDKCPLRGFGRFKIAEHLWKIKGGVFKTPNAKDYKKKIDTLTNNLNKVNNSTIPAYESNFKERILEIANNFKTKGAKITPYGHINFAGDGINAANNYVLHEFNIVAKLKQMGKTPDNYINGKREIDEEAANRILADLWYGNENKFNDVDKLLKKLNLTWHHHENLTNLQLVPRIVHSTITPHVGSVEYVKIIRTLNKKPVENANIISNYFTKFIMR